MKTNKACPKFQGEEFEGLGLAAGRSVAMTLEDEERMTMKMEMIDEDELVNVEGTKVKFSEKVIKNAEEIKRKTLQLSIPKVSNCMVIKCIFAI